MYVCMYVCMHVCNMSICTVYVVHVLSVQVLTSGARWPSSGTAHQAAGAYRQSNMVTTPLSTLAGLAPEKRYSIQIYSSLIQVTATCIVLVHVATLPEREGSNLFRVHLSGANHVTCC